MAAQGKKRPHSTSGLHIKRAAAPGKRQLDILEAGLRFAPAANQQRRALTLSVAHLVSGGGGAASMPYTTIPATFSPAFTLVHGQILGGFPSATTIRKRVLSEAFEMVQQWVVQNVMGKIISVGVDGGAGKMCNGIKVIPIIALSPALPHDLILDIELMRVHENGENQAKMLSDMCDKLELDKMKIKWLEADNNAVNALTVKILNQKYGFAITLARCIDHCLNLVFTAFIEPFEEKFKLSSFLRAIRSYIMSGGGQSRRNVITEHALSMSGFDSTATRWTSFMMAMKYLMGMQSKRELATARALLSEMAAAGDESAQTALDAEDVPMLRWDALAQALESMGKDEKIKKSRRKEGEAKEYVGGGQIAEVSLDKLLTSFADIGTFRVRLCGAWRTAHCP